ncbi:MAG: hypothetical protein AAFN78_13010 [Pseudomonadota bacterium]
MALITLLVISHGANTAEPEAAPLFASQQPLEVTIEGPLKPLMRERDSEKEFDGVLRYTEADGTEHTLDIEFRARGHYRLQESICKFPPLRLDFKRKQVGGTVFAGQNKLKLVTHCRPRLKKYDQYVLKEELAYRIFNLHSPFSFRSRLLQVNWIDSTGESKGEVRFGFLIEHKDALGERLDLEVSEIQSADYSTLNREQGAVAAVFEYLIGNTDFSMIQGAPGDDCCHNGLLLKRTDHEYFFVPYDFDMSGIVSAPYSKPNPRFGITSATQRVFRGKCIFKPQIEDTVAMFLGKQDDVMRLIEEQPGLEKKERRKLRLFLGRFYTELSKPELVDKRLMEKCI